MTSLNKWIERFASATNGSGRAHQPLPGNMAAKATDGVSSTRLDPVTSTANMAPSEPVT